MLLLLIWYKLENEEALSRHWAAFKSKFEGEQYWLMAIIVLLAPLSWIIESRKWRYLLLKIQKLSFFTALASILTGMSFALISPGKSGDFAGRILYLRSNIRLRGTIASMVGSFAHVLVTFCMAILGFGVVLIHTQDWRIWIFFFIALIAGGIIGFFYFRLHQYDFKFRKRKNWIGKIWTALKVLKRYDQRDLVRILGFSLVKFCLYTTQFVLVTYLFGSELAFGISFFTAAAMFWMIMVIPSFFIADVVVRGSVANLLFVSTGIIADSTPILAGTYIIWLTNWVIPSLVGALVLLVYRLNQPGKRETELPVEEEQVEST